LAQPCRRRSRIGLLVLPLLLLAGCALSDYEAHIEQEQNRLKGWDLETEYLTGYPLTLPASDDENAVRKTEIFFRAPKGTSTSTSKQEGILNVYKHSSGSEVFLAAVRTNDPQQRDEAREAFRAAVFKSFPAALDKAPSKDFHPDPEKPPMHFEGYQLKLEGQPPLYLYFYQNESYSVAIGYRVIKTYVNGTFDTGIDYSLASLLVGAPARLKHQRWKAPAEPTPAPKTGTRK
jgi:hypothetical protein